MSELNFKLFFLITFSKGISCLDLKQDFKGFF